MTTKTIPVKEVFSKWPAERLAKVKDRAAELIAEEYALRDLRKAKHMTQEQVAERLDGRQVYVSRLEKRSDMKLSTLRDYVGALGGELQLIVTFPEGETVQLKNIGARGANSRRRVRVGDLKT
jgi:predicted nuclease with TOPRIM domain